MKKMILPIIALALGIGFSAFTSKNFTGKQWHFTSEDLQDARVASAYEDNFGTVTCGGSELPCIIEVPHISGNTDVQDLQAYLQSFNSDQAVADAALSEKD